MRPELGHYEDTRKNTFSLFGAIRLRTAASHEVEEPVQWAIEAGYRHIDCAHAYGNEVNVGYALKKKFDDGTVRREDMFITSKLWCDSHRQEDVRPACEESLRRLKLEYLDLYLVQLPVSFKVKEGKEFSAVDPSVLDFEDVPLEETWRGMEELVKAGLVRSIGVSNFNMAQLNRILANCRIPPAVNQIEVSVHWLNQNLIDYCHSKCIQVTAFAIFGSPGIMKHITSPLDEEQVKRIALAHGKTPSQILLRHAIQRGLSVIADSSKEEKIKADLNLFDFALTKEEMAILNTSGHNIRVYTAAMAIGHPEYPFNMEC
ncbi:hypothetical protein SprV_0200967000 [Sparganum proliferum]